MERSAILDSIRSQPDVSVLIIGAGVNGIGLFRDLALQGVDVLIVDRDDFCSGASAASSHMVHGGLRYLENSEFRLVKEALTERNLLLRNAPHYVKPLPTTVPIFKRFSGFLNAPLKFFRLRDKPGERGAFIIKIGLMLYDFYARHYRVMPTHRFLSRAKSLEKFPKLNPDIINTAIYYDAWMPYPERICLEMVLDAEAASSTAKALNYVALESASGDSVTLRDKLTDEIVTVKPKIVVNAAGPWIDFANQAMGRDKQRFIGGTKGSHLVLDHPELLQIIDGHEIFFENADGRIVLIFPLVDRVLVGTTDIRIDNPDDAVCTDDEIDYMLNLIQRVFPKLVVNKSHIVFTFSGVRPLPHSDASTAGQISRDHSMPIIEPGNGVGFPIYSLVGGKWTTFRAFAEQAADAVLKRLGKSRQVSTAQLAIGGGADYPPEEQRAAWLQTVANESGVSLDRVQTLFTRYGTRAKAIAAYSTAEDKPLEHAPDYSRCEIEFLVKHEKVAHLDDLLLRRSLLGMLGKVNRALLTEIAAIMQPVLGWTDTDSANEIDRVIALFQRQHGINLE